MSPKAREPDFSDDDPDLEDDDYPSFDQGEETTPDGEPSQVWVNVLPAIDDALAYIHECIKQSDWEAVAIINYAEAVSNAIQKDIVDHPEWKAMDRNKRFGPLPEDYGEDLKAKHFMARYRLIRHLERKYKLVGRTAPQGEPAKFLSLASLCPKVSDR